MNFKFYILFLLIIASLSTCKKETSSTEAATLATYMKTNYTDKNISYITVADGLYIVKKRAGIGANAAKGKTVQVYYTGTFLSGSVFDRMMTTPYTFVVGAGKVITGWDKCLPYLYAGENATLIMKSDFGYGTREAGSIPANSTLVFDIIVDAVY